MPEFANRLDGIPMVNTTAERAGMFPSPSVNQRVHNLETDSIDRWTGSAWESLPLTISTTGNVTVASLTASGITTASQAVTGVLSVADGTASLPSVAFADDLNTGLYSPGADQVSLTAGGNARVAASPDGVDLLGNTATVNGDLVVLGEMTVGLGEASLVVSIGAADSGGTGYRVLRVPNA